jgi:hypothetical protein
MPTLHERRRVPRYWLQTNAKIHTATYYLNGTIVDISVEGIRLETYLPIEPETHVSIYFKAQKEIVFSGVVSWVLGYRKKGQDRYRIGIRVEDMAVAGIKVVGFDIKNDLIQEILTAIEKKSNRPD